MNANSLFLDLIERPSSTVMDMVLLEVDYWIADLEEPWFHIETPNDTGLSAVSLIFEDKVLEITNGWTQLRGDTSYHIQAHIVSEGRSSTELGTSEGLLRFSAGQNTPWSSAINHRLTAVEVYGLGTSPHIIRFSFADISLVVAIGYAASESTQEPLIGDGDELLVFLDDEWYFRERTLGIGWSKLWSYASPFRDSQTAKGDK